MPTTVVLLLQPPEVLKEGRMSPAMDIYGEQEQHTLSDSLHVFEYGLQQHLHSRGWLREGIRFVYYYPLQIVHWRLVQHPASYLQLLPASACHSPVQRLA
jgi:hypothetical protein